MLGVTFFGVFLTPVFYVTMRWLVERGQSLTKPQQAPPSADGHSGTGGTPEMGIKEVGR